MQNLTSVEGISNSFEITFVSTAQRQAIFFDPPDMKQFCSVLCPLNCHVPFNVPYLLWNHAHCFCCLLFVVLVTAYPVDCLDEVSFLFINSFRNVSVGVRGDGLNKSGIYTVLLCLFIWVYGSHFKKSILIFTNFLLKILWAKIVPY